MIKLNKNATQYTWPTNAFKVWKKEEKEIANIKEKIKHLEGMKPKDIWLEELEALEKLL